jgi:hypothetical protein
MTVTQHYQKEKLEISDYLTRQGKCVYCHLSCQRTKTVKEEWTPESRNGDGTPRTVGQIEIVLARELDQWSSLALAHDHCERQAKGLPPLFRDL